MGQSSSNDSIQNQIKQLQEELKFLKALMPSASGLDEVDQGEGLLPKLYGNTPNPFERFTTIRYFVPDKGHQRISLFIVDEKGDQKMFLDHLKAGKQKMLIKDHPLLPGIYFCSLVLDGNIAETCKMEVVKNNH